MEEALLKYRMVGTESDSDAQSKSNSKIDKEKSIKEDRLQILEGKAH